MRILLIALFSLITVLNGQQGGLVLIHADKSLGRAQDRHTVKEFVGQVHFVQDSLHMFCERALYFDWENRIRLQGNVQLKEGKKRLRAEMIDYLTEPKKALCFNGVQLVADGDSVYCQYLEYDFNNDEVFAREDFYLYSPQRFVQIWGDSARYWKNENRGEVLGNAFLIRTDSLGKDSLTITARLLAFTRTDTTIAFARQQVVIRKKNLRAVCDTAYYFPHSQWIVLKGAPKVAYENNHLSGERVRVKMDSTGLSFIRLLGKALVTSVEDSLTDKENRLAGKKIDFYVRQKKPQKILSVGSASSIYYLKNEQDEFQGVNTASADTIEVYFKQEKVDSIAIKGGARGVYYPQNYQGKIELEQ